MLVPAGEGADLRLDAGRPDAQPGRQGPRELALFARRKGDTWFLAAMNGPAARTIRVPLSFLGAGRYQSALVREESDGSTVRVESVAHTQQDTITLVLQAGKLYDQANELERAETVLATLECAGNSRVFLTPKPPGVLWELGAVGTAEWTGVPLAAVLEKAGVQGKAVEVILEGADSGEVKDPPTSPGVIHFARSLPLDKALDPNTLLAWRMNGELLTPRHGFPLRLVVPGWYGMASVKWLTRITVLDAPHTGYQNAQAYRRRASADDPGEPREHGLTFLPLLGGERSPGWNGRARGALSGLTFETTPEDVLRAALEGAIRFHGHRSPATPDQAPSATRAEALADLVAAWSAANQRAHRATIGGKLDRRAEGRPSIHFLAFDRQEDVAIGRVAGNEFQFESGEFFEQQWKVMGVGAGSGCAGDQFLVVEIARVDPGGHGTEAAQGGGRRHREYSGRCGERVCRRHRFDEHRVHHSDGRRRHNGTDGQCHRRGQHRHDLVHGEPDAHERLHEVADANRVAQVTVVHSVPTGRA